MPNPNDALGSGLVDMLDAVDEPLSIASAVRDRDRRLLDFRLEFVNEVVETGRPYHQVGAMVDDTVIGGSWVGGMYDMRAMRFGDGYISTWRRRPALAEPG